MRPVIRFGTIEKRHVEVGKPLQYERTHSTYPEARVFVPSRKPEPPGKTGLGDLIVGIAEALLRVHRSSDYLTVKGSWYTQTGHPVKHGVTERIDFWSGKNDNFSPVPEGTWEPNGLGALLKRIYNWRIRLK